jgi:hypothetical protein
MPAQMLAGYLWKENHGQQSTAEAFQETGTLDQAAHGRTLVPRWQR